MESGQKQLYAGIIVALIIIVAAFYFVIYPRYIADDEGDGGGGGGDDDGGNKAPSARITTNATSNTRVGDPIEFNATKSSDPDGDIILYKWDFGDGTRKASSEFFVINHTYSTPGEKTINLTVQDDDGEQGFDILTITIRQTDYHAADSAILSAQEVLPITWPENATFYFPVESDVLQVEITLLFTGLSGSQDDNFSSTIDILVKTPQTALLEQDRVEARGQSNETFIFLGSDLPIKDGRNYQIDVKCTLGTVLVNYEVDVRY